ncbi:MAG: zinc-dependent metalloprotease [Candidatus Kapabacteria bacterium]|nr:zinc-dependent metalloprotease [Ignavibacteriota bacterium]MCW5886173.1 zinc-dependent metalloprotease [Candidatus Kapabacteria bacterium]
MHEIGHILGLGHFDDKHCNNPDPKLEPTSGAVMRSFMPANRDAYNLTEYDKCAVAKLHCPTITSFFEFIDDREQSTSYPNPASDFITIQFSNKGLQPFAAVDKVQIFDMLGIEVMSVGTGLDLSTQRIDVSHLPAGVYFIRIGNKVEKFVKM